MPQRPNKPCRHRSCNTLTRDATGYCDVHRAEAVGWTRSNQGSASDRGYGSGWRKIRDWVMRRDDALCQPCAKLGAVSVAREVDHIVGKAQAKRLGWTQEQMDARENLQAICKACHAVKTAREARVCSPRCLSERIACVLCVPRGDADDRGGGVSKPNAAQAEDGRVPLIFTPAKYEI